MPTMAPYNKTMKFPDAAEAVCLVAIVGEWNALCGKNKISNQERTLKSSIPNRNDLLRKKLLKGQHA